MISFILSSRNDGYGGKFKDINTTMRRLQLSLDSIYALNFPVYEVIIVEWSPLAGMKSLRDEVKINEFTRILTVPAQAVSRIGEEIEKPIAFYEYLAKHIGILNSKFDIICVCNPDNIFPEEHFLGAVVFANHGHLVRAVRREIPTNALEFEASQLLGIIAAGTMPVLFEVTAAGGDFGMMKKQLYLDAGGYRLCHGNWDVDNEFERRVKGQFPIIYNYIHYHISHEFSAQEAPNRPFGAADTYYKFSDRLIQSLVDSTLEG